LHYVGKVGTGFNAATHDFSDTWAPERRPVTYCLRAGRERLVPLLQYQHRKRKNPLMECYADLSIVAATPRADMVSR